MAEVQETQYIDVEYTPSPTLARLHASPAFVRGVRGPIGSGKSVGCAFEGFSLACMQRPDKQGVRRTRGVIVRNTLPELKSTTIKTWLSWFPEGDPRKDPTKFGVMNWSSPITHLVEYWPDDGTKVEMEVIFLAMDQEKDVKKLLSLECSWVWLNEAREIRKDILDAATGRVGRYPSVKDGGCTRKAVFMDTNSPDEEHWWAKLEEDCPENWEFFRQPGGLAPDAENLENLNQPENWHELSLQERREHGRGYYLDMLGGKEPEWVNVYVHNQFGTIEKGVPVYKNKWNRKIHLADAPLVIIPRSRIQVGIDCSGRHPAAVYWQEVGMGRFQCVRELCIMDDAGMSAESFTRYFVDDMNTHFPDSVLDEIWGDPAGNAPSQNDDRTYFDILNAELRLYNLKAKASPGLRFPERYEAVCEMLSTLVDGKPLVEISPACSILVAGFDGKYMFKEINTAGGGTRVDDRPVKNRHSNPHDAFQYVACGVRARRGRLKRSRGPKQVLVVQPKTALR